MIRVRVSMIDIDSIVSCHESRKAEFSTRQIMTNAGQNKTSKYSRWEYLIEL